VATGLHPQTLKGVARAWRLPVSQDERHLGGSGHAVRRRTERADAPPSRKGWQGARTLNECLRPFRPAQEQENASGEVFRHCWLPPYHPPLRTAASRDVVPARTLMTVGPGHIIVPDPTVGLRGLPAPLCRAAHTNAPSTDPGGPCNHLSQRDHNAGFASSRAQHDATQGPTGWLTVGPLADTHRTSRSRPHTCRAAPSAMTPSRVTGWFPCKTVLEDMKHPPQDPWLVSPMLGGHPTGSQERKHDCRCIRPGDPVFYSGPSSAPPGRPGRDMTSESAVKSFWISRWRRVSSKWSRVRVPLATHMDLWPPVRADRHATGYGSVVDPAPKANGV